MLPKHKREAYDTLILSLILVILSSILTLFFFLIFKGPILKFLNIEKNHLLFYFLPVSIFLISANKSLTIWINRHKEFKISAKAKVFQTVPTSTVNLTMGLFTNLGMPGLFIGHITGFSISTYYLWYQGQKNFPVRSIPSKRRLINILHKNRNFMYFAVPLGLLNALSTELLVYILSAIFSAGLVGLYANANRVINYPLTLIMQSFAPVFYQKISSIKNPLRIYSASWLTMFIVASFLLLPISIWGPDIFAWVLGSDWRFSGKIAQALVPLAICGFASRSVATVYSLLKKNEYLLVWQITYLIISLSIIYIFRNADIQELILAFSVTGAIFYLFEAILGFYLLKIHVIKNSIYQKN